MEFSRISMIVHLVSTLLLVATGAWYGSDGGWEPVVVFLGFVVSFTGSGYKLLQSVKTKEEVRPDPIDPMVFAQVTSETLLSIPGPYDSTISYSDIAKRESSQETATATATLSLLRAIGLVRVTDSNHLEAVSEKSDAFVKSLGRSLEHRTEVLGDWSAKGADNPEAQKLLNTIAAFEDYRYKKQGNNASPAREVDSALILIKSKYRKTDVFLMQHSNAWGDDGYYWFIGGIREKSDHSMEACAYRELSEELSIERSMILNIQELCKVTDQRISDRVGCLTKYNYSIFYVSLDPQDKRVRDLHSKQFFHTRPVGWATKEQESRWLNWEEISASPELKRDAQPILDCISDKGVGKIPYATGLSVQSN